MTTMSQLRDALKTRLATIGGDLSPYDTWPGIINTPAALVMPIQADFHLAMGSPGYEEVKFEVLLLLQVGDMEYAQDDLDAYVDPSGVKSIKAAIEGDVTLAGIADSLIVSRFRDYGELGVNGVQYIGAVFEVTVWPTA
jgi:hypothetical protein